MRRRETHKHMALWRTQLAVKLRASKAALRVLMTAAEVTVASESSESFILEICGLECMW